jgi:hypothetical protein
LNNALVGSISRKERKGRKGAENYANYLSFCSVCNLHPIGESTSICQFVDNPPKTSSCYMFFAIFASFAAKPIIQLPNLGLALQRECPSPERWARERKSGRKAPKKICLFRGL